jgi:hypothetical protein
MDLRRHHFDQDGQRMAPLVDLDQCFRRWTGTEILSQPGTLTVKKPWSTIIVLIAGALLAHHADADSNLNCAAYATKAVEQQKQNMMLGCNFTGPGWHDNYDVHFQWCLLPNVQMADLVKEDEARDGAIQQCNAAENLTGC